MTGRTLVLGASALVAGIGGMTGWYVYTPPHDFGPRWLFALAYLGGGAGIGALAGFVGMMQGGLSWKNSDDDPG